MINWSTPIPIAGSVAFAGVFDSSKLLVWIDSTLPPTWRKAGYLRVELLFEGEYLTTSYRTVNFGKSLIDIPVKPYRLSFDPVNSLNTIYPNTSISIYPLTPTESIDIMGINFAPIPPDVLGDEVTTTIVASVTNVTLDPANANRREGFIVNKSNRNLWVRFGAAAAIAGAPTSMVPPNGNINIPDGYTGIINGIWSGPNPNNNAEIHQFNAV
jgi:hypothetical protein